MPNTQTSVPHYAQGEVLTAANLNLTNSGIPVFATTVTRDAAFGGANEKVLAEGQFAFLEDTNTTQYYDGAAWQSIGAGARIGQVVSTLKTDTFTTSSTSFVDITGLSVSITPTLATSKVLVTFTVQGASATNKTSYMQLLRGATAIAIGDAAGSRSQSTVLIRNNEDNVTDTVSIMFLDSPATTSATTYKLQGRTESTSNLYINRDNVYTNAAAYSTQASTITVMEVIV